MIRKVFLSLLLWSTTAALTDLTTVVDLCAICEFIYSKSVRISPNETYAAIDQRILDNYSGNFDANEFPVFRDMLRADKKKLIDDANDQTRNILAVQSCADLGLCAPKLTTPPPFEYVDITGTNHNARVTYTRSKSIVVLHHTVCKTIQETLDVLNNRGLSVQWVVAKNGTIYELVEDWNRAWHAGNGHWKGDGCLSPDLNSRSIGIEIVNEGDDDYPSVQLTAVTNLVKFLMLKWHIDERNVIAHADLAPARKEDVSGYWNWQWMYNTIGVFPGLFDSKLAPDQQKQVILNNTMQPNLILRVMQQKMIDAGYSDIVVGDPYSFGESSPNYSRGMDLHVEAFNRHYCPEIFMKETMNTTSQLTNRNPLNTQFYALTNERLDYLLANTKSYECANADN